MLWIIDFLGQNDIIFWGSLIALLIMACIIYLLYRVVVLINGKPGVYKMSAKEETALKPIMAVLTVGFVLCLGSFFVFSFHPAVSGLSEARFLAIVASLIYVVFLFALTIMYEIYTLIRVIIWRVRAKKKPES